MDMPTALDKDTGLRSSMIETAITKIRFDALATWGRGDEREKRGRVGEEVRKTEGKRRIKAE